MAQGKCKTKELEDLRKKRISESLKGYKKSKEHIKKIIESREENYSKNPRPTIRKMHNCVICGEEFLGRYGDPEVNKGLNKYCSRSCKAVAQSKICGETHPRYTDGTYSHGNRNYKYGSKNSKFRKQVLERDNYQCVLCKSSEELHVDHIIPFKDNKELRYEVTNGRTLCKACHYEITFRKSPLDNGKAFSRWAMVTRGKPSQDVAAAETK